MSQFKKKLLLFLQSIRNVPNLIMDIDNDKYLCVLKFEEIIEEFKSLKYSKKQRKLIAKLNDYLRCLDRFNTTLTKLYNDFSKIDCSIVKIELISPDDFKNRCTDFVKTISELYNKQRSVKLEIRRYLFTQDNSLVCKIFLGYIKSKSTFRYFAKIEKLKKVLLAV
ncbi:hypothetical protein SLOPH_713 [Spraguea lophii 42_110]|uniref:Uncharacterized protein n=1 Tax=Spraguea lophii (strain 42_110) TaxID=1358809 RepID=S7W9R5_SPRLO|nr:hypothetical protein SLOPH_713 [Spraguea lophii 42_110]